MIKGIVDGDLINQGHGGFDTGMFRSEIETALDNFLLRFDGTMVKDTGVGKKQGRARMAAPMYLPQHGPSGNTPIPGSPDWDDSAPGSRIAPLIPIDYEAENGRGTKGPEESVYAVASHTAGPVIEAGETLKGGGGRHRGKKKAQARQNSIYPFDNKDSTAVRNVKFGQIDMFEVGVQRVSNPDGDDRIVDRSIYKMVGINASALAADARTKTNATRFTNPDDASSTYERASLYNECIGSQSIYEVASNASVVDESRAQHSGSFLNGSIYEVASNASVTNDELRAQHNGSVYEVASSNNGSIYEVASSAPSKGAAPSYHSIDPVYETAVQFSTIRVPPQATGWKRQIRNPSSEIDIDDAVGDAELFDGGGEYPDIDDETYETNPITSANGRQSEWERKISDELGDEYETREYEVIGDSDEDFDEVEARQAMGYALVGEDFGGDADTDELEVRQTMGYAMIGGEGADDDVDTEDLKFGTSFSFRRA
jgi:hypothetical protein